MRNANIVEHGQQAIELQIKLLYSSVLRVPEGQTRTKT